MWREQRERARAQRETSSDSLPVLGRRKTENDRNVGNDMSEALRSTCTVNLESPAPILVSSERKATFLFVLLLALVLFHDLKHTLSLQTFSSYLFFLSLFFSLLISGALEGLLGALRVLAAETAGLRTLDSLPVGDSTAHSALMWATKKKTATSPSIRA